MKNLVKGLSFLLIVFFFLSFLPVAAQKIDLPKKNEIPEVDGTYNDPEHPGIKVRVFVHRLKPERAPAPTPKLECNLPDPPSDAVVGVENWRLTQGWTYNLNPNSVPSSVGKTNLATMAKNDFETWSQATKNRVTFKRGDDTQVNSQAYDNKNIIAWGKTSATALAVTYIRYFSDNGAVVDVDTIMNNKFPWSWSNSTVCAYDRSYDAEDILTHELGHWIGLDDEKTTNFQDNTMYGYGAMTEVKKITLTSGDQQAAYQIYNNY